MPKQKLIKRLIPETKHIALADMASKIHGTVPQVVEMAIDHYLKAMGYEIQ